MFQPETEDMLPRMPPKPSPNLISGSSEAIIRPQVPEVSILFGQQDSNFQQKVFNNPLQQQKRDYPQPTYAAWKKQMLPKVTFPANANMANTQLQENVMTGYNCATTNINPTMLNNPAMNIGSSAHVFGNRNVYGENQLTYRRSLENCNKAYQPLQNILTSSQLPNSRSEGVLTICAGTQTDANFESTNNFQIPSESLSNLATKTDVENVQQVLNEVRIEQQRILKILEAILLSQHSQTTTKTHCRSIGVQVELTEMDNPAFINGDVDFFQNHQSEPKNKFVEHLKPNNNIQSPKCQPIAQSTTYRPNSPKFQNANHDMQTSASSPVHQEPNKPTTIIPKSAPDTSIAMNELALKYLPNEKLAELLKELNMDCPVITDDKNEPTTPNRADYDKFGKGPSDISNASYKYLKKYRLLPEDNNDSGKNIVLEGEMRNDIENQIPQYNSPQYNIKNPLINQRQTPSNKCSPYPYTAGRLPLSPLARFSQSTAPQHIVDLDNIKQQPKFL